jgi:hypothetical protein
VDLAAPHGEERSLVVDAWGELPEIGSPTPGGAAAGTAGVNVTVTGVPEGSSWQVHGNGVPLDVVSAAGDTRVVTIPASMLVSPGTVVLSLVNADTLQVARVQSVFLVTPAGANVGSSATATATEPAEIEAGVADGGQSVTVQTGTGTGLVAVATYDSNPAGPSFASATSYFDVFVAPGSTFTELVIIHCDPTGNVVYWWTGTAWEPASDQEYDALSGCVTVTVTTTTSPSVADLMGTPFLSDACYDVTGDGRVTGRDLVQVMFRWLLSFISPSAYDVRFDPNRDGRINVRDVVLVFRQFGRSCGG